VIKADWDGVWSHYIKPRQDNILQQRGMRPQGRRTVDIEQLKKVLSLYRKIVLEEEYILRDVPADWGERDQDRDQETIRLVIHREIFTDPVAVISTTHYMVQTLIV
jgi:hypothetical protein